MCEECGKCVQDIGILNRLKATNTGVKPHSCTECGKCVAHDENLIIYIKVVHCEYGIKCIYIIAFRGIDNNSKFQTTKYGIWNMS